MKLKQKYGPFTKGEEIVFDAGGGKIAHIGFQYPEAIPTYLDLKSPKKTDYHVQVCRDSLTDAQKKAMTEQEIQQSALSYIQKSNWSSNSPFKRYCEESNINSGVFDDYDHNMTDSLYGYNIDFIVSFSDNTEYGNRKFRIDRNCILEFDDLRANTITIWPQRNMPAETIIDIMIDNGEI